MKGFPFIWLLFNTKTGKVVLGVLAFAIFFVLGMLYYKYYEDNRYNDNWPTAEDFKKIKNLKEDMEYAPDTVIKTEQVKTLPAKSYSSSRANDNYDNMRGFDPASEDDMDDNGMSRYMENNDEEGWD